MFSGKTARTAKSAPPASSPASGEYVAQVYVNRRKLWEERYANEDEAWSKAKQQKAKYATGEEGQDPVVIVRKAK